MSTYQITMTFSEEEMNFLKQNAEAFSVDLATYVEARLFSHTGDGYSYTDKDVFSFMLWFNTELNKRGIPRPNPRDIVSPYVELRFSDGIPRPAIEKVCLYVMSKEPNRIHKGLSPFRQKEKNGSITFDVIYNKAIKERLL